MKYSPTHNYLLQMISSFVNKNSITVVDFGCGDGVAVELFDLYSIKQFYGFDISKKSIEQAQKKYPSKKFVFKAVDNDQVIPDMQLNSVDVVIAIGVLQYLSTDQLETFFSESSRVLKEDGVLLISTTSDHFIYRLLDLYALVLPHSWLSTSKISTLLQKNNFSKLHHVQKGLIFAPLFSHNISLIFDSIDRFIIGTRGKIGPFGSFIRKLFRPLIKLEYRLPIQYGYTQYVAAKKIKSR